MDATGGAAFWTPPFPLVPMVPLVPMHLAPTPPQNAFLAAAAAGSRLLGGAALAPGTHIASAADARLAAAGGGAYAGVVPGGVSYVGVAPGPGAGAGAGAGASVVAGAGQSRLPGDHLGRAELGVEVAAGLKRPRDGSGDGSWGGLVSELLGPGADDGLGGEDERVVHLRERNRMHARQSRMRKKVFVDTLKASMGGVEDENRRMRVMLQHLTGLPFEELARIEDDGGAISARLRPNVAATAAAASAAGVTAAPVLSSAAAASAAAATSPVSASALSPSSSAASSSSASSSSSSSATSVGAASSGDRGSAPSHALNLTQALTAHPHVLAQSHSHEHAHAPESEQLRQQQQLQQVQMQEQQFQEQQAFEQHVRQQQAQMAQQLAQQQAQQQAQRQRLLLERAGPAPPTVASDYQFIEALALAQQNFILTDPTLPDNPVVFASQDFFAMTGYSPADVLGRNCRFMQGPATDRRAVDAIRRGVAAGRDTAVVLVNYKKDGTPFWNRFFVAALRGIDGAIVNYVGVQSIVSDTVAALLLQAQGQAQVLAQAAQADSTFAGATADAAEAPARVDAPVAADEAAAPAAAAPAARVSADAAAPAAAPAARAE